VGISGSWSDCLDSLTSSSVCNALEAICVWKPHRFRCGMKCVCVCVCVCVSMSMYWLNRTSCPSEVTATDLRPWWDLDWVGPMHRGDWNIGTLMANCKHITYTYKQTQHQAGRRLSVYVLYCFTGLFLSGCLVGWYSWRKYNCSVLVFQPHHSFKTLLKRWLFSKVDMLSSIAQLLTPSLSGTLAAVGMRTRTHQARPVPRYLTHREGLIEQYLSSPQW